MKTLSPKTLAVLALAFTTGVWQPQTASAQLIPKHRYSFDEAAGTGIAGDFYNGANGTMSGGADFTGTGAATLNGTTAFVDLPNGIISALTNATFETWITWNGGAGAWQRVFDFGNSLAGEGTNGTGSNYIFLTVRSGVATTRFGARSAGMTADNVTLDTVLPATNSLVHLAVSYNFSNSVARLYLNGAFASQAVATQALASIQDVNNWLGRSQWGADAYYGGLMHEFRIYDAALSAPSIAANAAAGPDNDGAEPGNLVSVAVTSDPTVYFRGTRQARIFATFDNAANVNVTFGEGATWSSSDESVATVNTNGVVFGVSLGTATITGTYQGQSASVTISVVPIFDPRMKHRYAFNETPGSTTVIDDLSGANGTLINASNFSFFTGSTLVLSNLANMPSTVTSNSSFVDLPNGIIRALTNASVEMWVRFVPVAGAWQRIFDFGDSGVEGTPGAGASYIFFTPRNGTAGGARFGFKPNTGAENLTLNTAQLPNAMTHVVITYHPGINVSRLYVNGAPVASGAALSPLATINDVNNWLGRSQFGGDTYFNGVFDEFRIYEGAMSEGDAAASFAAGPNVTNAVAGPLQSLELAVQTTMKGGAQAAVVFATYQNVAGVNVTASPLTTFTSGDPSIATVNAAGVIQALAAGTVTITASHNGVTSSKAITITGGARPGLVNRYSFNETGGTTVADSVGGKHGTILTPANASFGDGRLRLNNTGNAETNAYVDLPNFLIRSRTNLTIEMWVTWQGNFTADWQRFFDFGSVTSGVEGNEGTGLHYLLMTPRRGGGANNFRSVISTNSNAAGAERIIDAGFGPFPQSVETHVVLTYNSGSNGTNAAMSVWVNGTNVNALSTSIPLSAMNDYNNWLGRAQYNDSYFNGSYNEFRIYEGAMLPAEISASRAAGPDAVIFPALSISRSNDDVNVSWPDSVLGAFNLESVGALGVGETWTPVGGAVNVDGTNTATVQMSPTNQFFRLKK